MKKRAFQATCLSAFSLIFMNLSSLMAQNGLEACGYVDLGVACALLVTSMLASFGLFDDN